jgi:pilus assembly protein CpaF
VSKTRGETDVSLAERLARSDRPDRLAEVRSRIQEQLVQALGPKLYDASLSESQLQDLVHGKVRELLDEDGTNLSIQEKAQVVQQIGDGVMGLGPLEPFIRDPEVTEIMVNNYDTVYVERGGKIYWTGARFFDVEQLRRAIEKVVARVGRRIDESSPYVDARLPDGSRVNAIIPPLAIDGPCLTIRKFAADPYGTEDLLTFGTLSPEAVTLLQASVAGRINLLVSGGTGAGKTTTLNVLSSYLPETERIITIEDAAELRLQQPHVVRLEARPPNIEGKGEVTIRDLVRNALRMRPDRIVVGEVRGGEALDMLQAMNTGHDGSISTVHANSPRDVLSRLETMVLMSGMDLTVRAVREQVAAAIDVIVHQARLKDGTRRVTHVTEVVGMEGDVITLQDLFLFDYRAGVDEHGRYLGALQPTGLRPYFLEKLNDRGITLPRQLFIPPVGVGT